jgi:glycosyltransferase involved in cell wall biosynthesis
MEFKRKKIVFCIDSFNAGGTEFNLIKTIEIMSKTEYDLHILTLNDRGLLRQRFIDTGIPIVEFSFPRLHSLRALLQAVRISLWFRRTMPDVVHTNDRYTNSFVAPCARLAGVPLVITSRRWWKEMPRRIYKFGNMVAYRLSHRIVVNSSIVARMMSADEGIASSRITVLPNFVDDEEFALIPEKERAAARSSFGIPSDAILATAIAIFRPEKDLKTLILATSLLSRKYPRFHVLLVGDGPCEKDLRNAVIEMKVEDRVHFAGFLNGPPTPHKFGDIAVLCSLHEGFPNSIVEAMAAGKPVVATQVGGIPDAVEDGRTGILVSPSSPVQLAEALGRLIDDDNLRASMGEAGRLKAKRLYSASAVLEQLDVLYGGNVSAADQPTI